MRTRAEATRFAASGSVRINGQRAEKASRIVRIGDILTIALDRTVIVVRVLSIAERRGPSSVATSLYEHLPDKPEAP